MRVVDAAISQKPFSKDAEKVINSTIAKSIDILAAEGILPSSLKKAESQNLFRGLYPHIRLVR